MENKKILLVDDDEQILDMLGAILEDEGFSIDKTFSGEGALKKVEKEKYDLVISDVRMPGIDGFELLKQITDRFKDTRVIMMTGYTDDYDISDVLLLGAYDYITKPFDGSKVLISVQNALEK
ncbi:MAG TPA: response regulator [archaeon]|nr:response regulator [archaeon]